MSRPVIAISTYTEPASWGGWQHVPAALLPDRYVQAVRAGGGTPVLVPPLGPGDDATGILRRVDGLVVAGGADVNPGRYSETPHVATVGWRDDRDVSEFALLDAAADLDLPVLGICRGMQVMAVHAGGRLVQHVPDVVGHDGHNPGAGEYGATQVTTVPGSRLAAVLGERVVVPCHHHQAVASAPGFDRVAHADDGLLEAIEIPGNRFAVGIQWHPETGTDLRLFDALSQACLARV